MENSGVFRIDQILSPGTRRTGVEDLQVGFVQVMQHAIHSGNDGAGGVLGIRSL